MSPATFAEALSERLRHAPAQPFITWYDEAGGERTELSVTSYANWVSKTANLLVEELDLEPGSTVLIDLPAHWLVPVFLGAAWTAGVVVTTDPVTDHEAVVRGPEPGVADPRGLPVLACSLRPFAGAYPGSLPTGVLDHGTLWAAQSDVFVPTVPTGPDTPAWTGRGVTRATQGELLGRARRLAPTDRLITDAHPARDQGVLALLEPLVHHGSVVLVAHARDDAWPARHEDERATSVVRAGAQPAIE